MIGRETHFSKVWLTRRTKLIGGDLYLYLWSVFYFIKGGLEANFKSLANFLEQSWWQVGDAKKADFALNNESDQTF